MRARASAPTVAVMLHDTFPTQRARSDLGEK